MNLKFPNPSHSFDTTNNRVRFWGYDSVIEVSFSVEGAALLKLNPGTVETEEGYLEAFNAVQKRIYKAAESAYTRGHRRQGTFAYHLVVSDFN